MLYDARPRVGLNPLTTVSEPAGLRPLNSAALSASSVLQLSSSNRINREQQHTRQHHRERSNCEDQSERILCSSTLPLSLTFLEHYNGLICKRTAIAELPRAIACVCCRGLLRHLRSELDIYPNQTPSESNQELIQPIGQ